MEFCGTQLAGFGASREVLEEIVRTWEISNELFDVIKKPGSFPRFAHFEANENLHIGFRWSSTPGCYLIFFGSTAATQDGALQFRAVLSHQNILTPTWNADVMKIGEDILGQPQLSPLRLVVMLLNQCERHLENSIQQHAKRVETAQGYLPYPEVNAPARHTEGLLPSELYEMYRELTTSIFTLRNSCRNLMEICSGLMSDSKTALSSRYRTSMDHGCNTMTALSLLQRGIERIHARLKFQLNRIHYLDNIHIQATKSMAALKQLMLLNKSH
ncbi:hypothetical protein QR685DRAFT_448331 [Neurospora intermedia]|uniref:Uncharacterized protein n=1 Tax=Neurospora intermedia TaxID=5142 RepID=A0ABR3D4A7_NEUIN